MLRASLARALPARLKRSLRPLVVPWLYRLERPRLRRLLADVVRPGDLVFDIGAAEGYVTEVLLSFGTRVVAVEPQPRFLAVLERRLRRQAHLHVVAAGVAERVGTRTLHVSRGDPEISTFELEVWRSGPYAGHLWEDRIEVEVLTLDALIERFGVPAFCKIDVEGAEPAVLDGLSRPIHALSFELTGQLLDRAEHCISRLEALGPFRFGLSLGRRHELLPDAWVPGNELLDRARSIDPAQCQGDVYARLTSSTSVAISS